MEGCFFFFSPSGKSRVWGGFLAIQWFVGCFFFASILDVHSIGLYSRLEYWCPALFFLTILWWKYSPNSKLECFQLIWILFGHGKQVALQCNAVKQEVTSISNPFGQGFIISSVFQDLMLNLNFWKPELDFNVMLWLINHSFSKTKKEMSNCKNLKCKTRWNWMGCLIRFFAPELMWTLIQNHFLFRNGSPCVKRMLVLGRLETCALINFFSCVCPKNLLLCDVTF